MDEKLVARLLAQLSASSARLARLVTLTSQLELGFWLVTITSEFELVRELNEPPIATGYNAITAHHRMSPKPQSSGCLQFSNVSWFDSSQP